VIEKLEGTSDPEPEVLQKYIDPDAEEYAAMLEEIRRELNFTSLHFHRLDDMVEALNVEPCSVCTYCWNGRG
jgi:amidophosphoribosyltransferase